MHNTCETLNESLFGVINGKAKRNIFGRLTNKTPATTLDVIDPARKHANNQTEWDIVVEQLSPKPSLTSSKWKALEKGYDVRVEDFATALRLVRKMEANGVTFNNLQYYDGLLAKNPNWGPEDFHDEGTFMYDADQLYGYSRIEFHHNEANSPSAPHNDLPHIKWHYEDINGKQSSGHIFYGKPGDQW